MAPVQYTIQMVATRIREDSKSALKGGAESKSSLLTVRGSAAAGCKRSISRTMHSVEPGFKKCPNFQYPHMF
jgi:hypothetical protein